MQEYLNAFNILTPEEISNFIALAKPKRLNKGDFFIQEGKICKEVSFVLDGCFRSFYHTSSEEEVTYCFTFENTFVTAYSSFITGHKTAENIQALTDVNLLSIPKSELLKLQESSTNWLKLFKLLSEQEYVKMEKRIFLLQKEDAHIRYKDLLTNHPEYLQLIPLQYLSSYLGVSQRHLSRIRKSVTN